MSEDESLDPAGSMAMPDDLATVEIIATVSHELRSPLTSIRGFTSLMLSRWDVIDDDRKKEMLEAVRHDADRVTRMITELLDISRMEIGRLMLAPRPLGLQTLIDAVIEKVLMSHETLAVEVTIAPNLPDVSADADKIEQVLTNLVENAAKYASPQNIRIDVSAYGDGIQVAVTDAGAGIPPEDIPRVFDRFFRRDLGRPDGTGLGLFISRGLVEAHGGELTAVSTVDHGSTFTFRLPHHPAI